MGLLFMPENTKGSSALEASKGSAMVGECDCVRSSNSRMGEPNPWEQSPRAVNLIATQVLF